MVGRDMYFVSDRISPNLPIHCPNMAKNPWDTNRTKR